jgi:hypothetical protein
MVVKECDALLPSLLRCLRDRCLSALLGEEGGSALSYAERPGQSALPDRSATANFERSCSSTFSTES